MSAKYDRVCRLCLTSRGDLQPIFSTTSSDDAEPSLLVSKIKDCVSVHINEDDSLPTKVCKKCVDNVNNWQIFKDVCERTQNKLQSLMSKDGNQLEEVDVKSEPLSDEAYDDGVVIDGSYPEAEQNAAANKVQPEGPPILASLGLTPRSDKGAESDKEEEDEDQEMNDSRQMDKSLPHMPEVSITVMRPTGETLHAKQGIQQIASKNCLVCNRTYRYSHNARRHELAAHNFDRYNHTAKSKKSSMAYMQPKLRPNPFNPKARLMPNPISHKMRFLPSKENPTKILPLSFSTPKLSVPIKPNFSKHQYNNLPYPLRIKALKDLQIKKKEPQILKTLLTSKPEVLVSEPEIMNSEPGSPETLISEPEIASFQVEAILSEPDTYEPLPDEDMETYDEGMETHNNQTTNNHQTKLDANDIDSENEIEIARREEITEPDNQKGQDETSQASENADFHDNDEAHEENGNRSEFDQTEDQDAPDATADYDDTQSDHDNNDGDEQSYNKDQEKDDEELPPAGLAPVVEINEEMNNTEQNDNEQSEEREDETVDSVNPDQTTETDAPAEDYDPDKVYVTKAQRDFIEKYRNIIEQVNTKRCLCCNREYPRRKAVIQHLQKNGQKVPKHTCYNCVLTFSHIGALLSHIRANVCNDFWRIIYKDGGITDDMIATDAPKLQYKDIFNARSYACKLCPAKFQLKQFILKHVLEVHEDGQSRVPLCCVHCRARFKDKAMWKKHIRSGVCSIYIACDLCSEKFGNIYDFNNHALTVHGGDFDAAAENNQAKNISEKSTICPICNEDIGNYSHLVKHMKHIHNETKPNFCQHCDAKFESVSALNDHIYMEHKSKAVANSIKLDMSIVKEEAEEYHYSCTECNAIFETVDAWTDHQVAEHNQVAHHCDQCEKKFLRPSELAEHKNTHLRVKLYPCSLCADSYSTPQKLADHVQKAHPGAGGAVAAETEFYCDLCIRSFKSRQAYSNHMRIHAKVPTTNRKPTEKSFAPSIIGKPIKHFTMPTQSQPNFIQFKPNLNVPNAPYSCDICGKGFMHKKNIWKHKKVLHADIMNERNDSEDNTMHANSTEDDDFNNVDENGIALSTPQFNSFNFASLAQVKQEVIPPQPAVFSCEICFKKFPAKSNLLKHKRAKHGVINSVPAISHMEMPQPGEGSRSSCTICKITFSDKKSYYRHRKNVHKSTSQVCKICGIPLSSTLELYEHLKAAHARELLGYNANQGKAQEVAPEPEVEYEQDPEADPAEEYQARYPCDTCGRQFVGLLALQNHQCVNQMGSSQSQTFDCEICNKSYTSIAALKSHRGWHLRSPDGKAAANNSGLWMPHNKVTNKMSKHEVLEPPLVTRASSSATAAKRRLPPEVEVTVVNPNKKLRSDDSVDYEQMSGQGGVENRYCNICDKEFTKRAAYQRHMDEVHQPNSVFCPICSKSFTRKSTLLAHMKKHYEGEGSSSGMQDEAEFSCDLCVTQCMSENALRAHKIKYHGEEESGESEDDGEVLATQPGEFTCGQCGDGVATPRDLIAHRSMHSTPSQFFCSICKVYFARSVELVSHTRARHADSDKVYFPCAMCDRFFMNKKSLQRHIEMAH